MKTLLNPSWRAVRARCRREDGQAVTAVSVVAMLVAVAAAVMFIGPFSRGESELSKLKSGTDAAALAGAQQVAKEAYGKIKLSIESGLDPWTCLDGAGQAAAFATRNSTNVTRYCYYPAADKVEVTAQTNFVTATKRVEDANSIAETGKRLRKCTPDAPLVVTKTGYPSTATCGDVHVAIYVPPSTKPLQLVTPEPVIKAMFTVRLKK